MRDMRARPAGGWATDKQGNGNEGKRQRGTCGRSPFARDGADKQATSKRGTGGPLKQINATRQHAIGESPRRHRVELGLQKHGSADVADEAAFVPEGR
jgi:hypothetical protein